MTDMMMDRPPKPQAPESLDLFRTKTKIGIQLALNNPTPLVHFMVESSKGKVKPKDKRTLTGFTPEQAEIVLTEIQAALGHLSDQGKTIELETLKEIRPDLARQQHEESAAIVRKIMPDANPAELEFRLPVETLVEHELAHIKKAKELGADLSQATLSYYFLQGVNISPVVIVDFPSLDPISDMHIALAPKQPSESDLIRTVQMLRNHPQLFTEKPTEVEEIFRLFADRAGDRGYDLQRALDTGKLERMPK